MSKKLSWNEVFVQMERLLATAPFPEKMRREDPPQDAPPEQGETNPVRLAMHACYYALNAVEWASESPAEGEDDTLGARLAYLTDSVEALAIDAGELVAGGEDSLNGTGVCLELAVAALKKAKDELTNA